MAGTNSPEDENLPIFFSPAFYSLKASSPGTGTRIWAEIWMEVMWQVEMPAAMKALPAEQNGIPHKKKRQDSCHGVNLLEKIKGTHF